MSDGTNSAFAGEMKGRERKSEKAFDSGVRWRRRLVGASMEVIVDERDGTMLLYGTMM